MDMDNNYDAFDNYAMKYDLNESMIAVKYNHSYRVSKECRNICKSLNLDEEDTYLSELIGLLHDIGRFEQWTKYKTFSDYKSVDHADYSVEILFDEGKIKEYDIEEEYYEIIKKAIKYHNKYKIEDCDETEELFTKIIRDADKLDIFYIFSNDKILNLENNDEEISEEVKKDFFEHKVINKKSTKNINDKVLLKLGMVFDLNFEYSKEKILNEKYIDYMYKQIKNKKIFKEYFDEAKKYLKGSE